MIIKNAQIYQDGGWVKGSLQFDKVFKSINEGPSEIESDEIIDASDMSILVHKYEVLRM